MKRAENSTLRSGRIIAASMAAAAILLASVHAWAQEKPRVPLAAETVRQKATLLENLTTDSVSARTIGQSGDAAAKMALAEARQLITEAKGHLGKGELAQADAKLNTALELVNAQTKKVSKGRIDGEHAVAAYDKRIKSVRAFIEAYERVARQEQASSTGKGRGAHFLAQVDAATAAAQRSDYDQANSILKSVYLDITKQLKEWRDGHTLVKSLNFATQKDEYIYEIDRNDSHIMLLKLAQQDLPPLPGAGNYIVGLREEAKKLRDRSEQAANSGDYKSAIDLLEQSTSRLLNAIRMSGLFVPG